jgi:FtsP/CotA-like multicopper oxidase with cupredoxin domain
MVVTSEPAAIRRLRLIARVDTGGADGEPAYGFALEESGRPLRPGPLLPGPTIVLKRGEPVSITVLNELPEATAIHWRGMELQSYFDGVADFAGQPGRIAPAIAPRDSFEARFTPPRAGTFMYHTHVDEIRQQKAGLAGAMLVLDPAVTHDPATDLTFLLTTPRLDANSQVVSINGSLTPPPIDMRAGARYRLRLINLHTFRPSMLVEVSKDSALVTWRAVAKDGADLPAALATVRPARQQLGNGEAYDFELVPAAPGEMRISVRAAVGTILASVPTRVR